jgi:adenine phosphoribosyltransferase
MNLKSLIRDVPDFPKPGIVFKDITTLIKDGDAFKDACQQMAEKYKNTQVDKVVSIEARGFLFGAPVAYLLGAGIVPVRKPKKLPSDRERIDYQLEYGTDTLEIHRDGIEPGERVLIVDDLLATGGTALATCQLVEKVGGNVMGVIFLVELGFLKGREILKDYEVKSLITYDKE